jgi:2'-hydroxyisoflavone reductase
MKLLVLGGTLFIGRHFVDEALRRGHEITLFHRGKHGADLFTQAEHIHGDRDGGLSLLDGRTWDAAYDTCGYVPRIVRASAEGLADRVDLYVFVSTISVYGDVRTPGLDESAPLATMEDESVEEINWTTYGPLKVLCESAVVESVPDRSLIIRPGMIIGPYDYTDRFTYWPNRIAQGDDVLAPAPPTQPVQLIDVRDMSHWILDMIEQQQTGVYNATGPDYPLTMGDMLGVCNDVAGNPAGIVWVDAEFLNEQDVAPDKLPFWIPDQGGETAAIFQISIEKAITAGLTFRPLRDTVEDTMAYLRARPADAAFRAGLTREREAELLTAWRARQGI